MPPLPTGRIVAMLRAAFVVLMVLSIWSSAAFTSGVQALPFGEYVVTDVRQNGGHYAPLAGVPIEFKLLGTALEAYAGCNRIQGSVRLEAGRLTETGEGLYSGIMGCGVPSGMRISADRWLWSFLETRPLVIVDGDRVWLRGSAGSLLELMRVR